MRTTASHSASPGAHGPGAFLRRAVCALGFLLWAPSAAAAEGLYLTWGDCAFQGAGTAVRGFPCDLDTGFETLYCGLMMPQAVDSVLSMEIVLDLQVDGSTMPDYWRHDVGGCRETSLRVDADFTGLSACRSVWPAPSSVAGAILSYTIGMPRGGANQARIHLGLSVPSNLPRSMNGTDMYYAARIRLDHAGATVGCDGCAAAACLVLNSIRVGRPPRPAGVPTTDVTVTTPGKGTGNWASWQASSPAACQAVPIRNITWGRLKALYR